MPTDRRVLFGHHFAGDRRRRSAGRPGAGHADGLSARNDLDHHRRRGGRLRPGLPGAVHLGTPPWAAARSGRWRADELGVVGGVAAIVGVLVIMVILLAVLALVVVNAAGRKPMGRLLDRDDDPDRHLHGAVPEVLPPRPGCRKCRSSASRCCCSR